MVRDKEGFDEETIINGSGKNLFLLWSLFILQ